MGFYFDKALAKGSRRWRYSTCKPPKSSRKEEGHLWAHPDGQRQAVLQLHLLLWHSHSTGCSLQWPAEEGEGKVSTGAAEPELLCQHHQQRQQGQQQPPPHLRDRDNDMCLTTVRLQVKLFLEEKFWRLVLKCQALTFPSFPPPLFFS